MIPIVINSIPPIIYMMEYSNFWDTYLYQHESFIMFPPQTINGTIMSYKQRWINLLGNTAWQIFMKFLSYWNIKSRILELNKRLLPLNKSINANQFNHGFPSFWNKAAIIGSLGPPFSSVLYTRPRTKQFGFLLYPPSPLNASSDHELVEWLNNNDEPVLLISMGSVVIFSREIIQNLYNVLIKHSKHNKYRVIWALRQNISVNAGNDELESKHFKIMRWIPQFQLLQHGKIKLFLTHGGMNGVVESIFSKTLMIFYSIGAGDQHFNAMRAEQLHCGKIIKDKETFSDLTDHINTLLLNKQTVEYHQNAMNVLHDMLDANGDVKNATDFIQYAAKYGTRHLICTLGGEYGCNQERVPWHQQMMIDVYFVIILVIFIIALIIKNCCRVCCNLCKRKATIKDKTE